MRRQHPVIRREEYVAGTRERPEVGVFTCTHAARHPVRWRRIGIGEPVWMKRASGPVVARARVQGFRQVEDVGPEKVRAMVAGYGLRGLTAYWSSGSAAVVYLEAEEWPD